MSGLIGPEHTASDVCRRSQAYHAVVDQQVVHPRLDGIVPEEVAVDVVEVTADNGDGVCNVCSRPLVQRWVNGVGCSYRRLLAEGKHARRTRHSTTFEVNVLDVHLCSGGNA